MKKYLLLALLAGISLTVAYAQNTKKKGVEIAKKEGPKTITGIPLSWGGKALLESEKVNAALLRDLMQKSLTVTSGIGSINGFSFTYAERAMYEDSLGNPLPLTDYMTEYCFGDTLSKNIKLLLPAKVKAGDTVYIADVKVQQAAGKPVLGRPARIVIIP